MIAHEPSSMCVNSCDNPFVCKAEWDRYQGIVQTSEFAARDDSFVEIRIYEDGWLKWLKERNYGILVSGRDALLV